MAPSDVSGTDAMAAESRLDHGVGEHDPRAGALVHDSSCDLAVYDGVVGAGVPVVTYQSLESGS
jgi:hypothetical protein